jgi:CRP-like cAMP-binding protein
LYRFPSKIFYHLIKNDAASAALTGMARIDVLIEKLRQHSHLDSGDLAVVRKLTYHFRELSPSEDFIHQGDTSKASAVVIEGCVARYHTLRSGGRQYLSVHIAGDWPDAQSLFLEHMDHAVCAMGPALLCTIPHAELTRAFRQRPAIGFAVWRETLLDAAIFREAITNNSSRDGLSRLAHFFCELLFRSRKSGLAQDDSCALPFSQTQLGELLGMSIATVNRHIQALRKTRTADFRSGKLSVRNWTKLAAIANFDPLYLHPR